MLATTIALLLQAAQPLAGTAPETATYPAASEYREWPNSVDWYFNSPKVHAKGVTGRATLLCRISHFGELVDCKVRDTVPKGAGYGVAAKRIAVKVKMRPTPQGETRWALIVFDWGISGPYEPPATGVALR